MSIDVPETAAPSAAPRAEEAAGGVFARAKQKLTAWLSGLGLPAKLLMLTAAFVMLAEVLIFIPSVSNYRINWLTDRLTAGQIAALASESFPGGDVPSGVRAELLRTAQVKAIALARQGERRLIMPVDNQQQIDAHYDLRQVPESTWQRFTLWMEQIGDAIAVFIARDGRVIRVLGAVGEAPDDVVEIVMPEAPLKQAMWDYSLHILGLSALISLLTAGLVYYALSRLLVAPMMRMTRNMVHFGQDPEDPERIIVPSNRADELGTAERELASMQKQLAGLLLQKNRLAQLGLAVSKINHDLRNMLANAQLISDRLTSISDPTVQRFAPKLIASLDRAINFCNDSLNFGRAREAAPRREVIRLKPLVEEVADALGLPREDEIDFEIAMDDGLTIDVDRDHLFRVLSNLCRNSMQAIESQGDWASGKIRIKAWREGRRVDIEVRDDGPGLPPRSREHLFKAFQGSSKPGSTGLGLAIASELIAAHGGTVKLVESKKGATFLIEVPDRGAQTGRPAPRG